MTLIRSNIFVMRISYTSEWDHILNSNSEDILLLMLLVIYIYIYKKSLHSAVKEREEEERCIARFPFIPSQPHLRALIFFSFSFFLFYIYIYIYQKKKKKLCTKLRRERRRRKGASHVFPSSLLYTFESSHLLRLSPLSSFIYIAKGTTQ